MAVASIEVSGSGAERLVTELRVSLVAAAEPGDSVSPVEVDRSPELVIAVIGLEFSVVSTAKTIWDWWLQRRSGGVAVTILLADGVRLDLSGVVDLEQLATELRWRP